MALFRRKEKAPPAPSGDAEQADDAGPVDLEALAEEPEVRHARGITLQNLNARQQMVVAHLERIHEPGGLAQVKAAADFMDLGAARKYLAALEDVKLTIGQQGGHDETVTTRWTVTGRHVKELCGVPPSGEQVTIEGVTMTIIRDFLVVTEYSYWDFPGVNAQLQS